jgi:hypothetical protein
MNKVSELNTLGVSQINMPNASAYVVSNHSGYTTKIALYKKPNMIFRFIIWSAGWHIEEAGE